MSKIMTTEEMARLLQNVPPSDPEMEERIYTEYIRKGFIIYDGKKNKAICTRCGCEWDLAPGEYARMHGVEERCCICGESGILLAAGRGREKYTEYHRVLSFAQAGGTMYAFLNSIIVKFENWGRPQLYGSLEEVYIISKDEQTRWHLKESYYGDRWYESINNMNVPAPPTPPGYWYETKWEDHEYTDGLLNMLAESDCRYVLGAELMLRSEGMDLITCIGMMMKHHSVELLAKAGFNKIAQWKIHGNGCRAINWRGKNLEKILRLPRKDIRKLRPWDPTCKELEMYQQLTEAERSEMSFLIIRDMLCHKYYDYKTGKHIDNYRAKVEQYMPFDKWLRWAKTQEETGVTHLLSDYEDYMKACEKLGRDIRKKSILRPKNFMQAHDEAIEQVEVEKNAAIDKAIAASGRAVDFTLWGLTIRQAVCQEDLNKESAKLCHCVKTYGGKIARGDCLIFFIRQAEDPKEPYYTLETKPDGSFIQCRGLRNCSMTDAVKTFTDAFVKKLKAEIKKEGKQECQIA